MSFKKILIISTIFILLFGCQTRVEKKYKPIDKHTAVLYGYEKQCPNGAVHEFANWDMLQAELEGQKA